jgi:hypothetical protein
MSKNSGRSEEDKGEKDALPELNIRETMFWLAEVREVYRR